jgi:hypothetical protein
MNVFISYSKYDKELLEDPSTKERAEFFRILKGLERRKIWVDIDLEFVAAGDLWREKILSKIQKCRILVPVLSDDFIQSEFCNDVEVAEILKRRSDGNDILITPFYYRYCDWRQLEWIEERAIRPRGDRPYLSIEEAHYRTKAMIDFRSELETQSTILKDSGNDQA